MKVKKLLLKNFRIFHDHTEVDFDDFTAFVGKNDIGKSSILEALDIFLEGGVVTLDKSDLNVDAKKDEYIEIGVVFTDFPDAIIIDANVSTSLRREYLLNKDGDLEIHKVYKSISKPQIYIKSFHPQNNELKDLLTLKISELRQRADHLKIDKKKFNATISSQIREAIRQSFANNIVLDEVLIEVNKEDTKIIYDKIKEYFPVYALFHADRENIDKDSEIQDPMKAATKQVLKSMEKDLETIKNEVRYKLAEIAKNTIDKIQEMNPEIAADLIPEFPPILKWEKIFEFNLVNKKGIPLNKRGSGVRRLVLINFFRAEAERRRLEKHSPYVIYAIEEPETSQHPDWQIKLVTALEELSENTPSQVMVTTHNPGLAGLMQAGRLRLMQLENNKPSIGSDDPKILEVICETLGVLPNPKEDSENPKILVCVEGPSNVYFIKNLGNAFKAETGIDCENDIRIAVIPLGGSTLAHWVTNNYLRKFNIPEFHLYDKDKDRKYQSSCEEVNKRGDGSCAVLTSLPTSEHYVHPTVVRTIFGLSNDILDLSKPDWLKDWKNIDVVAAVKQQKKLRESKVKEKIATEGIRQMTNDLFRELGVHDEIKDWISKIDNIIRK